MLTQKQTDLFKLLEIAPEREAEIRKHYTLLRSIGVKKPFTGWLEDCLKAKWRAQHERIYLGD